MSDSAASNSGNGQLKDSSSNDGVDGSGSNQRGNEKQDSNDVGEMTGNVIVIYT